MAEIVLTDAIDMQAAILTDPEVAGIVKAFMNEFENEVADKIVKEQIEETWDIEVQVNQVIAA